jgi:His-Xaa-Ser system radical SAM maturase HxsB
MTKFRTLSEYEDGTGPDYQLLPFRFSDLDDSRCVLTNLVGEHHVGSRALVDDFVHHRLDRAGPDYKALKSKHFLADSDSTVAIDLLALKTRTRYERLSNFTGLHLFVVTLRCEHACPYCQVSRQNDDKTDFDMSPETADRALDLVFKSPSPNLKIEFQGGEPMLNFPIIRHIVEGALARNKIAKRNLGFVIATNLAVVTDDILNFCRTHAIHISTSLDGPANLHNRNRPRPGGDSHQRAVEGISRVRHVLGRDQISAVMTTTAGSLTRVREIIDEYLRLDFGGIFLRPLSPYGFAMKTKWFASYDGARWLDFYFEGLDYIIDLNKRGVPFTEFYASMILAKMLTPFQPGYVDLMSPAGIGIGALVYNYDGSIYASDESRMLAEMGDQTFRLGTVSDPYEQIILSDKLLDPLEASFAGSAPMCSTCAFEPYCGAEPVYHHALQNDVVGHKPTSEFCRRNMAIFRGLIARMEADPETRQIFVRWANR